MLNYQGVSHAMIFPGYGHGLPGRSAGALQADGQSREHLDGLQVRVKSSLKYIQTILNINRYLYKYHSVSINIYKYLKSFCAEPA